MTRLALLKLMYVVITIMLLQLASQRASAQELTIRETYIKTGRAQVLLGSILVVGGVGGIAYQLNAEPDGRFPTRMITRIVWPIVITGGSIIGVIGIRNIKKGKRMEPVIGKQHIPGLDHMGIVYPKYPTIGVKYNF